ncbi:AAA family ATPase [Bacteroidota bacterium]
MILTNRNNIKKTYNFPHWEKVPEDFRPAMEKIWKHAKDRKPPDENEIRRQKIEEEKQYKQEVYDKLIESGFYPAYMMKSEQLREKQSSIVKTVLNNLKKSVLLSGSRLAGKTTILTQIGIRIQYEDINRSVFYISTNDLYNALKNDEMLEKYLYCNFLFVDELEHPPPWKNKNIEVIDFFQKRLGNRRITYIGSRWSMDQLRRQDSSYYNKLADIFSDREYMGVIELAD